MKLQGSGLFHPKTLQSQNCQPAKNRLSLNGLEFVHGQLDSAQCSFQVVLYGHVVNALAHAPISTDEGGRYGSVKPAPIALLPGARAKLLPTGGVLSVPTEVVPTFTHPVEVFSRFGGTR
jgi:hypothetical protein